MSKPSVRAVAWILAPSMKSASLLAFGADITSSFEKSSGVHSAFAADAWCKIFEPRRRPTPQGGGKTSRACAQPLVAAGQSFGYSRHVAGRCCRRRNVDPGQEACCSRRKDAAGPIAKAATSSDPPTARHHQEVVPCFVISFPLWRQRF